MITPFLIFLLLGIIFGLFYSIFGDDIFEWNADPESINQGVIKDKKKLIQNNAPIAWKIERSLHRFTGVFIGWMLLWIDLDLRIKIFSNQSNLSSMAIPDFIILFFGFVGINGRLPTIAHKVENIFDWFKK